MWIVVLCAKRMERKLFVCYYIAWWWGNYGLLYLRCLVWNVWCLNKLEECFNAGAEDLNIVWNVATLWYGRYGEKGIGGSLKEKRRVLRGWNPSLLGLILLGFPWMGADLWFYVIHRLIVLYSWFEGIGMGMQLV